MANYARYPARNWFSFYSLRQELDRLGFLALDRFDVMDLSQKGRVARVSVACIRAVSLLRWLGHVATPGTIVLAVRLD